MATVCTPARRVKTTRPARKPPVRLVAIGDDIGGGVRVMRLTVDGVADAYLVRKVASAWGVAFEVCKLFRPARDDSPPSYHVNLDQSAEEYTCECRGHLRHTARTGKSCRHVSAILALIVYGRLSGEPMRPAAPAAPATPAAVATCPCGEPAVVSTGECLQCCDLAADRQAHQRDALEALAQLDDF
jgi:hypothetical protein